MTDVHAPARARRLDRTKLLLPPAIASAVLVAANGLLHLKIWNSDYRSLPSSIPGAWVVKVGFPINAAAAVALAVALVVLRKQILVPIAAAVFTAGSMAALILSRSSTGLFGWKEIGWSDGPTQVVVVEVLGLLALLVRVVLGLRQRTEATASA